jgi:hypothetical protein
MSIFGIVIQYSSPIGAAGSFAWNPSSGLDLDDTVFVDKTPFSSAVHYLPKPNLARLLEDLTKNITLSMFSIGALATLVLKKNTQVTVSTTQNVYVYDKIALLATYGLSIGLALVAVGIGLLSFSFNGVSMKTGFLSIMASTRNPDLDEMAKGVCLGAEGTMEDFKKAKVRFGEIGRFATARGGPGDHVGFGLVDSGVRSIVRDKKYV